VVLCVDYQEPVKIISPKGKYQKHDNNNNNNDSNNTKKKDQNQHRKNSNFDKEAGTEVVDFDSLSIDILEKLNEKEIRNESRDDKEKKKGKEKGREKDNDNDNDDVSKYLGLDYVMNPSLKDLHNFGHLKIREKIRNFENIKKGDRDAEGEGEEMGYIEMVESDREKEREREKERARERENDWSEEEKEKINFTNTIYPQKPTANSVYTVRVAVNGRHLECREFCSFSPSNTHINYDIDMGNNGGIHTNSNSSNNSSDNNLNIIDDDDDYNIDNNNNNNNNNGKTSYSKNKSLPENKKSSPPKFLSPKNEKKVNRELVFGFYDPLTNCCFCGYLRSFRVYSSSKRLLPYDMKREKERERNIENEKENFHDNIGTLTIVRKNNSKDYNDNNFNYVNDNRITSKYSYDSTENDKNKNKIVRNITTNKNNNNQINNSRIYNKLSKILKQYIEKKKEVPINNPLGALKTKNAIFAVLHDLPLNKIILTGNIGHSGQYRGKLINKW
jgi:hypothetical protein